MPQKKNPDVLELIRGRTARVIGDLTTLLVLVKGLPLAYNRDLQEDKEPLFDAFDTVEACLELAAVVVDGASLRADRIAERLDEGFLDATTLMEFLIQQDVPQRTAHEVIGRLVASCERRGLKRLADLPDAELREAHPKLGPEVRSILGVENADQGFSVLWLDSAQRGREAVRAVAKAAWPLAANSHGATPQDLRNQLVRFIGGESPSQQSAARGLWPHFDSDPAPIDSRKTEDSWNRSTIATGNCTAKK